MYFVYRDGRYIDVAGRSFRDFLDGRIAELKGITPTLGDWADHLTTLFPEVRLKRFLEMRGCDGGTWGRICGLPALFAGLLYDEVALDAGWDFVKDWTAEEREGLRQSVPKLALAAPFRSTDVRALAREMLKIATAGLHRRAATDAGGATEEGFIQPFWDLVERGRTRAEELLDRYHGEWQGDLNRMVDAYNLL
jgi:glutamate--cysteine ligase